MTFRGHNQAHDRKGQQVGPVPQRELVRMLAILIDTSRAKVAGRQRDEARKALRDLMATAHWNTPYVRRNIGVRRCRHLLALGYPVPVGDTIPEGIERLERLNKRGGI